MYAPWDRGAGIQPTDILGGSQDIESLQTLKFKQGGSFRVHFIIHSFSCAKSKRYVFIKSKR